MLKFLAAILITNSHMAGIYPDSYKELATGGAIGDALFFFCSGFALMLSRGGDFFNWYKRRINRIYPTIFAVAIVSIICGSKVDFLSLLTCRGKWFLQCIFLFYAIFWFVKRFFKNRLWVAIIIVCLIAGIWYFLFWDYNNFILADGTYLRWPIFFLFMLLGAYLGKEYNQNKNTKTKSTIWRDLILLFTMIAFYYGWQILGRHNDICKQIHIVIIPALIGVVYFIYRVCSSTGVTSLYLSKFLHKPMYWISALCLEIYLCGGLAFKFGKELIGIFPLNIVITFLIIFAISYVVKVLSNFLSQTFKSEDYDIKKMLTL